MLRTWQSANATSFILIGTRFNDRITGKLHEFAPNAQIVHIDIDTASISRNIHVDVPIVADALEAVTKMNEYVEHCETKKWQKTDRRVEGRTSFDDEEPRGYGTAGYY